MSQPSPPPSLRAPVLLGALLWLGAAFGTGYLVGAARQFSRLPVYHLSQEIPFDSKAVTFVGWSAAEREFRWSDGKHAQIIFRPEALDPNRGGSLSLTWVLERAHGQQPVTVSLNGEKLGTFGASGGPQRISLAVPRRLWRPLADNVLETEHLQASSPGPTDPRKLALALRSVQFTYQD